MVSCCDDFPVGTENLTQLPPEIRSDAPMLTGWVTFVVGKLSRDFSWRGEGKVCPLAMQGIPFPWGSESQRDSKIQNIYIYFYHCSSASDCIHLIRDGLCPPRVHSLNRHDKEQVERSHNMLMAEPGIEWRCLKSKSIGPHCL